MGLPSPPLNLLVALAIVATGAALAWAAARSLLARRRESRLGPIVAADAGAPMTLRSARYRLSGRPDLVRRLPDGRLVPIEIKSRAPPPAGPLPSHRVQVAAYCLLIEEATGRSPPFGIVRYGDGSEFEVRWDAAARARLLALRAEIDRPYDGRATPSAAKCGHCGWRTVCDARVRAG